MPLGLCAIWALCRMQMYSAWAPNLNPVLPKTWSPTANSLTAAPTASTTPASSQPRIRCRGPRMPDMQRLSSMMAGPLCRLASRGDFGARLLVRQRHPGEHPVPAEDKHVQAGRRQDRLEHDVFVPNDCAGHTRQILPVEAMNRIRIRHVQVLDLALQVV